MSTNQIIKNILHIPFFSGCMLLLFCVVLHPNKLYSMDFAELHKDTGCDCIATASQNCIDLFSRKGQGFRNSAFKLTKTNRDAIFTDCDNHCKTKSLSIDLWNEESAPTLHKKHGISAAIAPEFRDKFIVFKIKQYGGLIKATPSRSNKFHHDFYYADNFDVNKCLEYIKTVKINYP